MGNQHTTVECMVRCKRSNYSTADGNVSCVSQIPAGHWDTLCPVVHVIRSISENFCDCHGTWLFPGCNHRNFQKWVITTELSGHDRCLPWVYLWDTVRHRKLYHYKLSSVTFCIEVQFE